MDVCWYYGSRKSPKLKLKLLNKDTLKTNYNFTKYSGLH